ncbi:MAG: FAD-binding protein [Deltaproteobacteria bacterium]|nr:FAD-binding protein [Deltaproteobacteria bacterium]
MDRDDGNSFHKVKGSEGHSYPRGYLDRREGVGFCHALEKALIRAQIVFYPETPIVKLLLDDGQVIGALGFDLATGGYRVFNSKVVILATGGLGQLFALTTNARSLTGDGYAMAFDAGAELVDMEMVQFMPLSFPYPESWKGVFIGMSSLWGPDVRLYNGPGERYMGGYDPERLEYATRDIAARANYTEIMEGRGTEHGAIVVDPTGNDPGLLSGFQKSLPHIYNRVRKIFGEDAANWKKTFEAIPSQHFFMGGVVVDEKCCTGVPGLFAVGEVCGGVHGANRLSGTALAEIFVFGDLAGENVTGWMKDHDLIPAREKEVRKEITRLDERFTACPKKGVRPFEAKRMIKDLMWRYLGPVRQGGGIRKAISAIDYIRKEGLPQLCLGSNHFQYNRERVELCEVTFMVKAAAMIALSALDREESRGSHYRTDYPAPDDRRWLKNIVVAKGNDGEPAVSYKPAFRTGYSEKNAGCV